MWLRAAPGSGVCEAIDGTVTAHPQRQFTREVADEDIGLF